VIFAASVPLPVTAPALLTCAREEAVPGTAWARDTVAPTATVRSMMNPPGAGAVALAAAVPGCVITGTNTDGAGAVPAAAAAPGLAVTVTPGTGALAVAVAAPAGAENTGMITDRAADTQSVCQACDSPVLENV
jgi:hypothetical protein